eukprot:1679849-Pleurochrysis_carterae.AAC.2
MMRFRWLVGSNVAASGVKSCRRPLLARRLTAMVSFVGVHAYAQAALASTHLRLNMKLHHSGQDRTATIAASRLSAPLESAAACVCGSAGTLLESLLAWASLELLDGCVLLPHTDVGAWGRILVDPRLACFPRTPACRSFKSVEFSDDVDISVAI